MANVRLVPFLAVLAVVVCLGLCAPGAPSQAAVDSCLEIGEFSGCSGCNLGSKGQCEWCVDPRDETGLAGLSGGAQVLAAKCLPKGHCANSLGGGRVSARRDLCPADPNMESHHRGELTRVPLSTLFSTGHYPRYCRFGYDLVTKVDAGRNNASFTYLTDRSVERGLPRCTFVNNNAKYGVGISVGLIADRCFGRREWPLTPRMKACLESFQAFRCTSNCPMYGKAIHGFCQSSCDQLLNICEPFMGNPDCPFTQLAQTFEAICVPDNIVLCDNTLRISASESWKQDYGFYAKYNLPIDCTWTEWSAFGDCDVAPGDQCSLGNPGVRTRTRRVDTPARYDGACPGDAVDYETCPASQRVSCVDCAYAWNAWSACTNPCYSETARTRTARVITQPGTNGQPCPGPESGSCCTGITMRFFQYDGRYDVDISSDTAVAYHVDDYRSHTVGLFMDQTGANSYSFEKSVLNFRQVDSYANDARFLFDVPTRWYYTDGEKSPSTVTSMFFAELDVNVTGKFTFFSRAFRGSRFIVKDSQGATICSRERSSTKNEFFCAVDLTAGSRYSLTYYFWQSYHNDYGYLAVAEGDKTSTPAPWLPDVALAGFKTMGSAAAEALGLYLAKTTRTLPAIQYVHRLPTFAMTRSAGANTIIKRGLGRTVYGIETAEVLMETQTTASCINNYVTTAVDIGNGGFFTLANPYTLPSSCASASGDDWAVEISGVINIPNSNAYTFCVWNAQGPYLLELDSDQWTSTSSPQAIVRLELETPRSATNCKTFNLSSGERQFRFIAPYSREFEILAAVGTSSTVTADHRILGDVGGLEIFTAPASAPN